MRDPLVGGQMLAVLQAGHGLYNTTVAVLLLYDGSLGFAIRRARRAGGPPPLPALRRHRKLGPPLALLGMLGFSSGLTLALLDSGRVLAHPAHLAVGSSIVVLLAAAWLVSRRIRGGDSPYRTPHLLLGLAILGLYIVDAVLGLGILL